MTLANRLVMPPMATAKAEPDGKVSQALLDYYAEKSRGGYLSLIIIEHSYIAPEGKASENQLSVCDDTVIPGLRKLSDIIHRNGSMAAMQINHAGSAAQKDVTGATPLAPSARANPRRGDMPREMSRTEIIDIVNAFKNASRRVKEAGFDAVEIHSAHGYLLNQFLSPLTNKRKDDYGGDISNRIRIHLQVIEAVHSAVGPDFPVQVRLGPRIIPKAGQRLKTVRLPPEHLKRQAWISYIFPAGLSDILPPAFLHKVSLPHSARQSRVLCPFP